MIHQISQTQRVNRSPHTGGPILEELNTHYGYYAAVLPISESQYRAIVATTPYSGPLHPAQLEHEHAILFSCG